MPNPIVQRRLKSRRSNRLPVSGAQYWWDAGTVGGVDGGHVSVWTDRISGVSMTSLSGPSNQPTLAQTQNNGHPAIRWNAGSNQELVIATSLSVSAPYTIWVNLDSPSVSNGYIFDGDASGNRVALAADSSGIGTFANKPFIFAGGAAAIQSSTAWSTSTFQTLACLYVPTSGTLYLDAVSIGTGSLDTINSISTMVIGKRFASGFFGTFWLVDMLIWPRALTAGEVTTLNSYFRARYGR